MKRPAALATLLVVSTAVGAWLFLQKPPAGNVGSCEGGGACTAQNAEDAGDAREPEPVPAGEPAESIAPKPVVPSAAAPPAETSAAASAPAPPADAVALRKQSDELLSEGRYPEAIAALKAATRADPTARNHGDLGELLEKMLNLDEALVHFRKAADLDPDNPDRWITLANAYYRKVDPGKAWAAEKRARQADPTLVLGFDASGKRVRKTDATGDSPAGKP